MKNYILTLGIVLFISLVACENRTGGNDSEDRRDTIRTDQNRSGVGGQYDNNSQNRTNMSDSSNMNSMNQRQDQAAMVEMPQPVRNAINNDDNLKNRTVESSRTYTESGRTYYEITFSGAGTDAKVVFDENGNRQTTANN